MIKLQTFDNFLTPLRFFRPWKAVEAVNDDAAYHFFPPKWRQWLTPASTSYTYFWEFLVLVLVLVLESKDSITRLLLVFAHEKLPFYLPTERQKAKINNEANKIFIFFELLENGTFSIILPYWAQWDMRYTLMDVYIQIFEWHRPIRKYLWADTCKRFFQNIWNHIFSSIVLKYQGLVPYEKGRNTRRLV